MSAYLWLFSRSLGLIGLLLIFIYCRMEFVLERVYAQANVYVVLFFIMFFFVCLGDTFPRNIDQTKQNLFWAALEHGWLEWKVGGVWKNTENYLCDFMKLLSHETKHNTMANHICKCKSTSIKCKQNASLLICNKPLDSTWYTNSQCASDKIWLFVHI